MFKIYVISSSFMYLSQLFSLTFKPRFMSINNRQNIIKKVSLRFVEIVIEFSRNALRMCRLRISQLLHKFNIHFCNIDFSQLLDEFIWLFHHFCVSTPKALFWFFGFTCYNLSAEGEGSDCANMRAFLFFA